MKRLLIPDLIVSHVSDVTPVSLQERGIRGVISDLDNTLVRWRDEAVAEEVAGWLVALQAAGITVCIASNTRHYSRLDRLAQRMGIHHVPGNAGKPGTGGLRRAMHLMGTTPTESAMVGDQLFTDIVAGNRLDLMTILVNPLSSHEFIGTRLVSRTAEKWVLRGPLQRAK